MTLPVSLFIGQLATVKPALMQISDWIFTRLEVIQQHYQLVIDLGDGP